MCAVHADNISGTHTTSTRYGASSDAAPAQRLLALAWEHAEELFGQRVATDWHNAWQHGSGPVGVAGAPGMSGGSMFGVYKQKARWVCWPRCACEAELTAMSALLSAAQRLKTDRLPVLAYSIIMACIGVLQVGNLCDVWIPLGALQV